MSEQHSFPPERPEQPQSMGEAPTLPMAPVPASGGAKPTVPAAKGPLLELMGVSVYYGEIAAVRNLTLTVNQGEVVALLGANGAGKTTTLRTISGLLRPRSGTIWFEGQSIVKKSAESIARLGIAHLPEGRGIFPRLSVAENLRMAAYGAGLSPTDTTAGIDRAVELFPVLGERLSQLAGTLSGGQQQMLAVGRALVTRPRLLMIDELSFGLAPGVVKQLFAMLPAITASGTAILLVEQFVGQALDVARRAYVLEKGELTFSGTAAELAAREGFVASSYLGSGAVRPDYQRVRSAQTEMLRVRVDPALIRHMRDVAGTRPLPQVANEALQTYLATHTPPDTTDGASGGAKNTSNTSNTSNTNTAANAHTNTTNGNSAPRGDAR